MSTNINAVKKNKVPLRQCVGCKEMRSKKELLRIVRTEEGHVMLDPTGRKNGRGAYICPSRDCLKLAIKNHGLNRTLKCEVGESVYEELEKELEALEKPE